MNNEQGPYRVFPLTRVVGLITLALLWGYTTAAL